MIRIVELFSGIGSQAKAFERISKKRAIKFEVLNTCEWDIHAIVAYDYIHNGVTLSKDASKLSRDDLLKSLSHLSLSNNGKELIKKKTLEAYSTEVLRKVYSAIEKTNNLISVEDVRGCDLPNNITVMTYSFPCQDLSNVGALHGYNKGIDRNAHTRSGLLWEVERMLIERKDANLDLPKFLLLENVTSLEAKRNRQNFDEWKEQLEKLGYINKVYKLYAPNFGVPQNRKRLLMLSVYVGSNHEMAYKTNEYFNSHDLENAKYAQSLDLNRHNLRDLLKIDYSDMKIFTEALQCQPKNTKSRRKIWDNNSQILLEDGSLKDIVQTITTKQDRHPNSGNIFFNYKDNTQSLFRFLTPRECFLLMGFDENDYNSLVDNNFPSRKNSLFFSRDRLYKLSGNSIVVNMLEAIFNQVLDIYELLGGNLKD